MTSVRKKPIMEWTNISSGGVRVRRGPPLPNQSMCKVATSKVLKKEIIGTVASLLSISI